MTRLLISGALGLAIVALSGGLAASAEPPRHGFAQPLAHAMITDIQKNLSERGYYAGPIDGELGPLTTRAIRTYQRDAGLQPDGRADQEVANMLRFGPALTHDGTAAGAADTPKASSAPAPTPDPYVRAAQQKLRALGYDAGPVDGLMGPKTRTALQAFFRDRDIVAPVAVTPEVFAQLMAAEPSANRTAQSAAESRAAPSGTDEPRAEAAGSGAMTPVTGDAPSETGGDSAGDTVVTGDQPVTRSLGEPAPHADTAGDAQEDAPSASAPDGETPARSTGETRGGADNAANPVGPRGRAHQT